MCAVTAVVEAAVHESLELDQNRTGTPVFDPHTTDIALDITITWSEAITTSAAPA